MLQKVNKYMGLTKYKGFVGGDVLPAENINSIDPDNLESPISNEAYLLLRANINGLLDYRLLIGVDGSGLINIPMIDNQIRVSASDNLKYSSDTQRRGPDSNNELILKEFTVQRNGVYRVKFDGCSANSSYPGQARIYKNGVAYGTSRSLTSQYTTFTTYSEDLSFAVGDKIQIWTRGGNAGGAYTYIKNFRLYFDRSFFADVLSTIDTGV